MRWPVPSCPGRIVQRVEPRAESVVRRAMPIYVALLFAILTAFGLLVLVELRHVLFVLFVSIVFAAALSGPTARLEALRLPRGLAAVLIYLFALGLIVGTGWLILPPLFEQLAAFADRAPGYARRYEGIRETYENLRENYPALAPFDRQMSRLGEAILGRAGDRVVELPAALFAIFLDVLAIFFISLLLVTNRERIVGFFLNVVHPTDREQVAGVIDKMWNRVGYYLRAKVIEMAIIGTITYVALRLIGVPFAVPLAIVVALGEAIPRAGPWLARIPLLGVAGLEGWETFLLTFGASVLIEGVLKGFVIAPMVEGHQLEIHPLFVFVAVLVGASLGGFAGAFIAVPMAALLETLFEEVVLPWRQRQMAATTEEPPLPPPPEPA
jgi:predicted PurR-regulated permease PerM